MVTKIIAKHAFGQGQGRNRVLIVGATFCTKVFWVFVFGHFFCPFLKRGFTFVQKAAPISGCEHYDAILVFLQ